MDYFLNFKLRGSLRVLLFIKRFAPLGQLMSFCYVTAGLIKYNLIQIQRYISTQWLWPWVRDLYFKVVFRFAFYETAFVKGSAPRLNSIQNLESEPGWLYFLTKNYWFCLLKLSTPHEESWKNVPGEVEQGEITTKNILDSWEDGILSLSNQKWQLGKRLLVSARF